MNDDFIKTVTVHLKNEFEFVTNDNRPLKVDAEKNREELTKYALKALECFKEFEFNQNLTSVLAIIGCKLLNKKEKEAI